MRWWRGVVRCEDLLHAPRRAIHVMDREGDNYDLFAQLQSKSIRYVIRLAHNRNLVGKAEKLKDLASKGECIFKREIRVAALFKEAPAQMLQMIVVHELAHLKVREHDKAFYALCEHMLADYHQIEFDTRLYLTWRALEVTEITLPNT